MLRKIILTAGLCVGLALTAALAPRAAADGEPTTLEGHGHTVTSLAFSPDGKWLASGSWDQKIKIWDVAKGEAAKTLEGHGKPVLSVAWSPDGKWLATGSYDRKVFIWDVAAGTKAKELVGHGKDVTGVAFTPDGKHIVSSSLDGSVRVWDVASAKELRKVEPGSNIRAVCLTPDGSHFMAVGDKEITLWILEAGTPMPVNPAWNRGHKAGAWSPDGRTFVTGADKVVRIGKIAAEPKELAGHKSTILAVAFAPGGKWVASGSKDYTIRLWDAASGEEKTKLEGHQKGIASLACSPDGKWLASGSEDKTIKIWAVQ